MATFESGVSSYIKGSCTVVVNFPIDLRGHAEVSCSQCPFYRPNYRRCGLNDKLVAYGEKYVGQNCPLEFTGEIEKENDNE